MVTHVFAYKITVHYEIIIIDRAENTKCIGWYVSNVATYYFCDCINGRVGKVVNLFTFNQH